MSESVNYKHVSEVDIVSELLGSDTQQLERNGDFQRIKGEKIGTKAEVNQLRDSISANKQSIDAQATSINQLQQTTNTHGLNIQKNEVEIGKQSNEQDVSSPAVTATSYGSLQTYSDSANKPIVGLTLYGKTTQDGTPSPDNPAELVSVGNKGNIGLMVRGKKNLLKNILQSQTNYGVNIIVGEDGSITANGTVSASWNSPAILGKFSVPGTYLLSIGADYNDGFRLVYKVVRANGEAEWAGVTKESRVVLAQGDYIESVYLGLVEGTVLTNYTMYPMLRFASNMDATFEPCQDGGNATFNTPNGLHGVPVSSGGNYTDDNGQQWICDEIDLARGVYIKRVGMVDYDMLSWTYSANYAFWSSSSALSNAEYQALICETVPHNIIGTTDINTLGSRINAPYNVWVRNGSSTEQPHGKAIYMLAKPVETPLTSAELDAFGAMKTQYPNTTIINDEGAYMKATYVVDTSHHVEQQMESVIEASSPPMILSESGSVITVNDSAHRKLTGLKLYGKTTQVQTTGKNLLRNTATSRTVNGVSFTVNADGSVTAKGTASSEALFEIMPYSPNVYDGMLLTGAVNPEFGLAASYIDEDGAWQKALIDQGNGKTLDGDGNTRMNIAVRVTSGATVDGTVYPMIRLASIADATYEPYSGGYASPSPNWAQPLINVGAGSDISVKVRGKNLLKQYSGGDSAGIATEVLPDGYTRLYGTSTKAYYGDDGFRVTLYGGQTYTFSVEGNQPNTGNFGVYMWPDVQGGDADVVLHSSGSVTLYVPKTDTYRCMPVVQSGVTVDVRFRCTLTPGTDAIAYEPYKDGGSLNASTPNGLPGIPVSNGGNYTDDNGQQWICDEIDLARGVYVQRIGKYTFTGQEVTQVYGAMNANGYGRYQILMLGADAAYVGNDKAVPSLCTGYAPKGATELAYLINNDKTGYYFTFITVAQMAFSTNAATVDAFKAEITGTTIMYQLATPIETPLPSDVLRAFNTLTSQYPATTIFNDAGVGMSISYVADIKSYIDQRIAAMLATNN